MVAKRHDRLILTCSNDAKEMKELNYEAVLHCCGILFPFNDKLEFSDAKTTSVASLTFVSGWFLKTVRNLPETKKKHLDR